MSTRFQVAASDFCMPGMERLRNRDEILLVAYPNYHSSVSEIVSDILTEVDVMNIWEDDASFDAAKACVRAWLAQAFGAANLFRAVYAMEPEGEDFDHDAESPALYVYLRDAAQA